MFRYAIAAFRSIKPVATSYYNAAKIINYAPRCFSTLHTSNLLNNRQNQGNSLINNTQILDISKSLIVPTRTVTKFSLKRGKRKTVKAAVKRFFRLHWGGWIRTKVGRHKKMWKKSGPNKRRLRQHVFCNSTQVTLLDKMVTSFWKKPKYYVDDPYAPYHTREEYHVTRKKPKEFY